MKQLFVIIAVAAIAASSCATVQQNIDARAYLAKCRYEYAGLQVTSVKFSTGILIDAVDFDLRLKITNPTDRDVALDHAAFSFFLDRNPVLDLAHQNFVRIAPTKDSTETLAVALPFGGIVKSLGHRPEKIGIKAKLWLTLLVGKDTWETPIVIPVEVELPVPYDQIDAFVAQRKQQLEKDAAEQARKAAADAASKSGLPSLTPPHF